MVKSLTFLLLSLYIRNIIARPSAELKTVQFLSINHQHGKTATPIAVQAAPPTTPPVPIGESEKKKQCPVGFEFLGKQCSKTLTASPETICPSGTSMVEGRCVKYLPKFSECPLGYESSKGVCVKVILSEQEISCPDGYTMSGKDTCVRKVPLPDKFICPAGSVQRGDDCVVVNMAPPQFTCPQEYVLQGKKCRREETFDCTPERPSELHDKTTEIQSKNHHANQLMHGKDFNRYTLPQAAPMVEEYVVSETCKRVTTEPVRQICEPKGVLDGKLCRIEEKVSHIKKSGGLKDEFIPILRNCPLGFAETDTPNMCKATEEKLPLLQCPPHTVDLDSRCAVYSPPRTVCPPGFSLEGKSCIKVTFAAPIVEYTVTYECTGKNCEQNATHRQSPAHLRH